MLKDNATENLRARLKPFADTLEEVLSSPGDKSEEEMSKIRNRVEYALRESRHRLSETSDVTAKQTRKAAAKADNYVREDPWTDVGIGATVGVALGALLSRR